MSTKRTIRFTKFSLYISLLLPVMAQAGIFGLLGDVENAAQSAGIRMPSSLSNLSQLAQEVHDGGYSALPGMPSASTAAACPPGYTCTKSNAPTYPSTQNIAAELAQLTYIQEGNSGPVIYDFQDPLCPYCHKLFVEETTLIREGRLIVRYVPVAFLSSQSTRIAADILQSPNPPGVLNAYESVAFSSNNAGLRAYMESPTGAAQQDLDTNKRVMEYLGFNGVPALVFQLSDGHYEHIDGLISTQQMERLLPEMASPVSVTTIQGSTAVTASAISSKTPSIL